MFLGNSCRNHGETSISTERHPAPVQKKRAARLGLGSRLRLRLQAMRAQMLLDGGAGEVVGAFVELDAVVACYFVEGDVFEGINQRADVVNEPVVRLYLPVHGEHSYTVRAVKVDARGKSAVTHGLERALNGSEFGDVVRCVADKRGQFLDMGVEDEHGAPACRTRVSFTCSVREYVNSIPLH